MRSKNPSACVRPSRKGPGARRAIVLLGFAVLLGARGEAAALAGEAAIGLAILVTYFRNRGSIAVEDINLMKG